MNQSVKSFDDSFKDFNLSLSISNTIQTMAKDRFEVANSDILLESKQKKMTQKQRENMLNDIVVN